MKHRRLFFGLLFFIVFATFLYLRPQQLESANLTSVKDSLSSAQLSFFARIGVAATNTTLITINTGTTLHPSYTTANLFGNDIVGIGHSAAGSLGSLVPYTVKAIGNTAVFEIGSTIAALDSYAGLAIVATRSAIHTVSFTPVSALPSSIFQLLIKATNAVGETINDGIPDQNGFDQGQDVGSTTIGSGTRVKIADITCPLTATASIGATTTIGSSSYHTFNCTLPSGTVPVIGGGTTYTMIIGRDLGTGSQLINPSAAASHSTLGVADVYTFFLRHLNSSSVVIDSTQGKIALVESVRVTATVDPTLTFIIDNTGVGVGATPCGNTLGAAAGNTTATAVAFGSLTLGSFNDLAQRLTCITNAYYGYVVQVYESDRLKNLSTGDTFADTNCDGAAQACTTSVHKNWNTDIGYSGSEFGYSLQNLSVGVTIFNYDSGVGATFAARPFAIGSSNAQTIMSNTAVPSSNEIAYVCYRATVSTTQGAGDYENQVNYVATATF